MPINEFDISQIYSDKLGYIALPYPLGDYSLPTADELKNRLSTLGDALIGKSDLLGRPYILPVFINGNELPMPVMNIEASKNIVKTVVAGRKGTVKELVSADDYMISIRGIVLNQKQDTIDIDTMRGLYGLYELNESVKIDSALTEVFQIENAVIESFKINPVEGKVNVFTYDMRLISDDDFEAIFNE